MKELQELFGTSLSVNFIIKAETGPCVCWRGMTDWEVWVVGIYPELWPVFSQTGTVCSAEDSSLRTAKLTSAPPFFVSLSEISTHREWDTCLGQPWRNSGRNTSDLLFPNILLLSFFNYLRNKSKFSHLCMFYRQPLSIFIEITTTAGHWHSAAEKTHWPVL